MPESSFPCHDCGQRVEDTNSPIVIYVVAGLAPMHPISKAGGGQADITDYPMPPVVRELFGQATARLEFCVGCFAARMGHPLVDAEGQVVAEPQDAQLFMRSSFTPPLEVVAGRVVNPMRLAEAAARAEAQAEMARHAAAPASV